MNLLEFSKLIAMLFTTNDKYEITFNLCDKDGARTYTIDDFLSFGDIMNDQVILPKEEYYVQVLEIKRK